MTTNTPRANSAQNTPLDSIFDLYLFRRLIAENVPSAKAERIKRRQPALVVKFSGMVGGAA